MKLGPLAGIKIVDLSQVFAGPYGPALLADAGADVIKVETHQGEIGRVLSGSFLSLNRGKRGIAIDLHTDDGKKVLHRLARWADVLVENFRPGVMKRLTADYETLAAINPGLIYVSISALGDTSPYGQRPGFDPLAQALTGIELAQGGQGNPPVFLRIPITDITTAMMQAAAITMALFDRQRNGGTGCHITTSLLRNGIFVNAEAFTRFKSLPAQPAIDGGQHGLGPLDRMYATSDGWVFLLVEEDETRWQSLIAEPAFAPLAEDERFTSVPARRKNADTLAEVLSNIFATRSTEAWLTRLRACGVPCAPVIERYEHSFFEDVQPMINLYSVGGDHAERGRVEHPGNLIQYSAAPTQQEARAAPLIGQHTDEILAELGFDAAAIASMRERGVII